MTYMLYLLHTKRRFCTIAVSFFRGRYTMVNIQRLLRELSSAAEAVTAVITSVT